MRGEREREVRVSIVCCDALFLLPMCIKYNAKLLRAICLQSVAKNVDTVLRHEDWPIVFSVLDDATRYALNFISLKFSKDEYLTCNTTKTPKLQYITTWAMYFRYLVSMTMP